MDVFKPLKSLLNAIGSVSVIELNNDSLNSHVYSIPTVLLDYYIFFGNVDDLNNAQNNLISMERLHYIGDYLIFYTENQCMARWGIHIDDLKLDNPPVYVTYDERLFSKETDTLSNFLIAMGFFNMSIALPFITDDFCYIDRNTYNAISQKYNLIAKIEWDGVEIYQNHHDDIICIFNIDGDIELQVSSNSKSHFFELIDYLTPLMEF